MPLLDMRSNTRTENLFTDNRKGCTYCHEGQSLIAVDSEGMKERNWAQVV